MGQLGEILIGADPVISPRRQFPPPHYLEQLQRDHPPLFHLNAFDSPPPSPGNELEDYDFNMQIDLNGVIPADVQLLDEFQQENDKTGEPEHLNDWYWIVVILFVKKTFLTG